jgi:GNAT superfamily N-acetyltransferase
LPKTFSYCEALTPPPWIREDILKGKPKPGTTAISFEHANLENRIHVKAIRKLLSEYMADSMGGKLPPHSDAVHKRMIAGLSCMSTAIVMLAYKRKNPVGMAICFAGFSTFSAAPLINIHDIIVSKKFRGIGIGKGLLQEIENLAVTIRCCKMTLEVRHDNWVAKSLYKRIGFTRGDTPMDFLTRNLYGNS